MTRLPWGLVATLIAIGHISAFAQDHARGDGDGESSAAMTGTASGADFGGEPALTIKLGPAKRSKRKRTGTAPQHSCPVCPDASVENYSWVDDDGVLHFSEVKGEQRYRSSLRGDGFGGKPVQIFVIDGRNRKAYAVDVTRFDSLLRRAAEHYRLPFSFVKAVAKVESNFNPRALSSANAKGLMQLIDSTARAMNVRDSYDPEQNVFGGVRYLRLLANMFDGDLELTAAAYNAGPRRVKKSGGIPGIRETQRYVARVRKMYCYYRCRK